MIAKFLALVFFATQAAAPPAPQDAPAADALSPLPADQQGAIRCSAAFALGAERQRQGLRGGGILAHPPRARAATVAGPDVPPAVSPRPATARPA